MMNKQIGQMYSFCNFTWNPIRGKCYHDCSYCSIKDMAKRFNLPQKPIKLIETEYKTNLGEKNFIFVGSSIDLFANDIPEEWIKKTLNYCLCFPTNRYLFQSKNPKRMLKFTQLFHNATVLGTTIETDQMNELMGKAPAPIERAKAMAKLKKMGFETMLTIEPIMQFNLEKLLELIKMASPDWVNIGADSKAHQLPEPNKKELLELIEKIKKITVVKQKSNLERLLKG